MSEVFIQILNMSISASWIIPVVLILRLLLKKAPKWINVILWGIVAVRLICPFTIESVMSLIPSGETVSPDIMMDWTPQIDTGIPVINSVVNPIITGSFTPHLGASANPLQILIPVIAFLWLTGIAIMLLYTLISCWRVKRKIKNAVLLWENIYQSDAVGSPFVFGLIKPKIYLPMEMGGQDMELVIAHEKAHICRKDHLWKPVGFLILTLHWFNPFVWLGYVLLCRDIELACDEKVIEKLDTDEKADYSQALLSCSINRRTIAACPLAFGEVGVKDRIKAVLHYKKPAFWIIVAAIVVCITCAVCFLTNPQTTIPEELSVFIDGQICDHQNSTIHPDNQFIAVHHEVLGVEKFLNKTTVYMWVLYHEYAEEDGKIKTVSGSHIPTVITAKTTGLHGHYELVEYWVPGMGSQYAPDIRARFPWYLHGKALDSERYIDKQLAFCDNAAKEYFGIDIMANDFVDIPEETTAIIVGEQEYSYIIDEITFDIDGDGEEEQCVLTPGPTSGVFSFVISVYGENGLKYNRTYTGPHMDMHFEAHFGEDLRIVGDKGVLNLKVKEGQLYISGILSEDEMTYEFWDPQESDSPYTPVSIIKNTYEAMDTDVLTYYINSEQTVVSKTHYELEDGTWMAENYIYQYRLEVTGRMHNAAKNTTYVILSNIENISFDQAWRASGYSSNMEDYFDPADAVIVGYRMFE